MGTDATRCTVCGGQFSAKRIIIDGCAYHARCAAMSYPSHTHENYSAISDQLSLALGALEHIWKIVHRPTKLTPYPSPADHFQADFNNIRKIIAASPLTATIQTMTKETDQ